MTAFPATLRQELVGLGGIVERNVYLTKRYFLWDLAFMVWTIANTLTIVFIARAVHVSAADIFLKKLASTETRLTSRRITRVSRNAS